MPIQYQPTAFSTSRRAPQKGPMSGGLPLNAIISRRTDLNSELAVLTVSLDGWELAPFEAGQFIDIGLQARSSVHQQVSLDSTRFGQDELIQRSYSVASSPESRRELEILLNLVPRGEFTPQLWRLESGSRVHVRPRVRGRFTLSSMSKPNENNYHPHVVFIATGTGIAPYMSMLRHSVLHKPAWSSATLLHSVRVAEDLAYREELEELQSQTDLRFTYIPTVTRADDGTWTGQSERIQQLLAPKRYRVLTNGRSIRKEDAHVFLCGNPEMILELKEQFEDRGFVQHTNNSPGNLHFESYW